ncbi:MAG: AAA family ATPase [Planctomycetota bacterium]
MFSDVIVGHERPLAYLQGALRRNRLPHALLFAGPEGVGKASVARRLAQTLLCGTQNACGQCRGCHLALAGQHPDWHLLEREPGRTAIALEQLHEMQAALARRPLEGRSHVVMIDAAHRMRGEAQDCLLKTLEEPPQSVVIILVTHRPELLRPTVRSRCQTVAFAALEDRELRLLAERLALHVPDTFPMALAGGRIGVLQELLQGDLLEARAALLALLREPSAVPAVHFAARLVAWAGEGAGDDEDARERSRERLRVALRLLANMARDTFALRELGAGARLLNTDLEQELAQAGAVRTFEDVEEVLLAVLRGLRALAVNVSSALVVENLALELRGRFG